MLVHTRSCCSGLNFCTHHTHAGVLVAPLMLLLLLLAPCWLPTSAYEPKTFQDLPNEKCDYKYVGSGEASPADKQCTSR